MEMPYYIKLTRVAFLYMHVAFAYKFSFFQDEPSVSLKLGIETKTSMSSSGESVGSRKEISTKDSSHDAPSPKVVKDTGNHGVSVTEERHR